MDIIKLSVVYVVNFITSLPMIMAGMLIRAWDYCFLKFINFPASLQQQEAFIQDEIAKVENAKAKVVSKYLEQTFKKWLWAIDLKTLGLSLSIPYSDIKIANSQLQNMLLKLSTKFSENVIAFLSKEIFVVESRRGGFTIRVSQKGIHLLFTEINKLYQENKANIINLVAADISSPSILNSFDAAQKIPQSVVSSPDSRKTVKFHLG